MLSCLNHHKLKILEVKMCVRSWECHTVVEQFARTWVDPQQHIVMHTRICTYSQRHACIHTDIHSLAYKHICLHTDTHTKTHTHANTHTYTHTLISRHWACNIHSLPHFSSDMKALQSFSFPTVSWWQLQLPSISRKGRVSHHFLLRDQNSKLKLWFLLNALP